MRTLFPAAVSFFVSYSKVVNFTFFFTRSDEFEAKLDENGRRLKQTEMDLIDAKSALSSTLKNMGKR